MANAIEDALNRAPIEQRERAEQVIAEARSNIQIANVSGGDISSSAAASVVSNAQIIEDARRNIPFETMQSVETVSPPMNTLSIDGITNSTPVEVNPIVQNTIETIEQGSGNNYQEQNAVDRALARQEQPAPQSEPQQQEISR